MQDSEFLTRMIVATDPYLQSFSQDPDVGEWMRRPWWLFWKPIYRRKRRRWTVDDAGCQCFYYWEYGWWGHQ